jgi:hypothetical protein
LTLAPKDHRDHGRGNTVVLRRGNVNSTATPSSAFSGGERVLGAKVKPWHDQHSGSALPTEVGAFQRTEVVDGWHKAGHDGSKK